MKPARLINLISVIVIVIFANLLAVRFYSKIDLTENRIYTISKVTKGIIKKLDGKLVIKVVVSDNIPSPYNTSVRFFLDILDELKSIGKGKVEVDVISGDTVSVEKAANLYGIPPVQVNAIENDSLQIKKIYMGAVLIYKDKTEMIPIIANVSVPEYELASLIKKMSSEKRVNIAIIDVGNSATTMRGLRNVAQVLRKNYNVEDVKLEKGKLIDKKFDIALLVSPMQEIGKELIYPLEEFLFSGKSLILALDEINGNVQAGYATQLKSGIEKFLEKNGFQFENKLIYDANATLINVSRDAGGFIISTAIKYPFFPEVINFNQKSLITKGLSTVNMIFPYKVTIKNKNLDIVPLLYSSDKTALESEPFNVSIERKYNIEEFKYSNIPMAFFVSGKFTTEFSKPLKEYKDNFKNDGEGKLIFITDGEMFQDSYVSSGDNLKFIQNMVDYLSADSELLELRSKIVKFHPINLKNPDSAIWLKYTLMFLPSILVVLIGVVIIRVFGKRRVRL